MAYVRQHCTAKTTVFHNIQRREVFEDVNHLLSDESVLMEYPLQVKFQGEIAFDSGVICFQRIGRMHMGFFFMAVQY